MKWNHPWKFCKCITRHALEIFDRSINQNTSAITVEKTKFGYQVTEMCNTKDSLRECIKLQNIMIFSQQSIIRRVGMPSKASKIEIQKPLCCFVILYQWPYANQNQFLYRTWSSYNKGLTFVFMKCIKTWTNLTWLIKKLNHSIGIKINFNVQPTLPFLFHILISQSRDN